MYQLLDPGETLSQGDVIDDCPFATVAYWSPASEEEIPTATWTKRAVVLTQACDLAQDKTTRVVIAPIHAATELVSSGILKAAAIRDQIRRNLAFGWYFLPSAPVPIALPESIVDLRELHTLERSILEHQIRAGKRVCRIMTPWREHLAQHFGVTYCLPPPLPLSCRGCSHWRAWRRADYSPWLSIPP